MKIARNANIKGRFLPCRVQTKVLYSLCRVFQYNFSNCSDPLSITKPYDVVSLSEFFVKALKQPPQVMDLRSIIALVPVLIAFASEGENEGCLSKQYLEVGREGIIQCSFETESLFGILWYNTTDLLSDEPVVVLKDSVRSGYGYTAGEYDIFENGSLIIINVTLSHERMFTVKLLSRTSTVGSITVKVESVVKPNQSFPIIKECAREDDFCYIRLQQFSLLNCFVKGARPAIKIEWIAETSSDISNHHSENFTNELSTETYTSRASATYSAAQTNSPLLSIVQCKATDLAGVLKQTTSLALVEHSGRDSTPTKTNTHHIQFHSSATLPCSKINEGMFVWKTSKSDKSFEVIAIAELKRYNLTRVFLDDVTLSSSGSLMIRKTVIEHEGYYICISNNSVTHHKIIVTVNPTPSYLIIPGCEHKQYCVIDVKRRGNLTCKLLGIRPAVQLEWVALQDPLLSFKNMDADVQINGDKFDVTQTSEYSFESSSKQITVECRVKEPIDKRFSLTARLDLSFTGETAVTNLPEVNVPKKIPIVNIAIPILVVLIVAIICLVLSRKYDLYNRVTTILMGSSTSAEEMGLTPETEFQKKKKMFIKQLKHRYISLCDRVLPTPFSPNKVCGVEKLFVENGFDGEKYSSHHDVFKKMDTFSKRCVIVGDPGYGKSTLLLQFAYEWCYNSCNCPLQDIDVLILLRLGQVKEAQSILNAIKLLILPEDSKLSVSDISDIIEQSSTFILLDGGDEYADQDGNSEFHRLMQGEMFQDKPVILATRPSSTFGKISTANFTVKLTGFDKNSMDDYINKVVPEDENIRDLIRYQLDRNTALFDLCQVPLLFAMFVSLAVEDDDNFKQTRSMTCFFSYAVACLHSHMKNKGEGKGDSALHSRVSKERSLHKIAYQGLTGRNNTKGWIKDELKEKLGGDVYKYYVTLGILHEKEGVRFTPNRSGIPTVRSNKEVAFSHHIFCEWYAAHHLVGINAEITAATLRQPERQANIVLYMHDFDTSQVDLFEDYDKIKNLFKELDPNKYQHVYRFACGLDMFAGHKLIMHLKQVEEYERLTTQCLLEYEEEIVEAVRTKCKGQLSFHREESNLQRICTLKVLLIAAKHQIPITNVEIYNTLETVTPPKDQFTGLLIKSEIRIPLLKQLEKLVIWEDGKTMQDDVFLRILEYASQCDSLKTLTFLECLLPRCAKSRCLDKLKRHNTAVYWKEHKLNFDSGKWMVPTENKHVTFPEGGSCEGLANFWKRKYENEMTDERYEQEERTMQNYSSYATSHPYFKRREAYLENSSME